MLSGLTIPCFWEDAYERLKAKETEGKCAVERCYTAQGKETEAFKAAKTTRVWKSLKQSFSLFTQKGSFKHKC